VNGGGGTFTFATADQRKGDFSSTLTADGRVVSIYDPLTTKAQAADTRARPFPETSSRRTASTRWPPR